MHLVKGISCCRQKPVTPVACAIKTQHPHSAERIGEFEHPDDNNLLAEHTKLREPLFVSSDEDCVACYWYAESGDNGCRPGHSPVMCHTSMQSVL